MRSMANVERPIAAESDSLDGWTAVAFFAAEIDRERTQHVDGRRIDRGRRGTGAACATGAPSGLGRRRHGRAELQGGDPLRSRVPRCAAFDGHACARRRRDRRKTACRRRRPATAAHARGATRRYRRCRGQTTSTLSSSIERVEPTSNASNIRCAASKTAAEIRSGSISPSAFFSGAVQSDPPPEPNAAAKMRASLTRALPSWMLPDSSGSGADAELDGPGLEHGRAVTLGLERDVGDFDGKELRAVDRHARRSQHGVDIHARKTA